MEVFVIVYKYWLLMRGMVENYCPEMKFNLGLLFTEAHKEEVSSRPRLNFTKGTIIFYHSPNKRAVNICFIKFILARCVNLVWLLKGVLHPRSVFGLSMLFSQKLQHIGNKKDMFLIGNISGNLITALEFH